MRPIWLALTLLLILSSSAFSQTNSYPQPEGSISGTVFDEHGQPFKGVLVCTYMLGAPSGSAEARGGCPATTDEAGQFHIDHVVMGTFGVEAIKPEDEYVAFAGTSVKDVVTVTATHPSATVVLKLGPRAGVVLPSVKDKVTGNPVTEFQVGWAIYGSNSSSSGGQAIRQGERRAIVPSEKTSF